MIKSAVLSSDKLLSLIDQPVTLSVIVVAFIILVPFGISSAQSVPGSPSFNFPGSPIRVSNASGNFSAVYKPSAKSDGDFVFSVEDKTGKSVVEHIFSRSVDGEWSSTGASLYLNDYLGSTQIDCFVWMPQSKGLLSLTEVLLRDPKSGPIQGRGAKPPETPENSRYELTCHGWKSDNQVLVDLEGTTWAGGQFKYKLLYDLKQKQFKWN